MMRHFAQQKLSQYQICKLLDFGKILNYSLNIKEIKSLKLVLSNII